MAFSRLFVFRQIFFYRDFEWDKVTFLLFRSSFRLSEKNEKDKKRKEFLF